MPGLLLDTLNGRRSARPPIWLMRQAGRYLPEYRALRAEKGGFLALVYDDEAAAEITLQPIRRFGFDGAILFSDILIVPYAMGQDLQFLAGEGPQLSPPLVDYHAGPAGSRARAADADLCYRGKGPRRARPTAHAAGFAGSPWTVATYMGRRARQPRPARRARHGLSRSRRVPGDHRCHHFAHHRISRRADRRRRRGGAIVRQLGRHAGSRAICPLGDRPQRRHRRRAQNPLSRTPIIGFPKGAGEKLPAYARETGVDAIALDETIDPVWAAHALPADLPVQGNLDPLLLLAGGRILKPRSD